MNDVHTPAQRPVIRAIKPSRTNRPSGDVKLSLWDTLRYYGYALKESMSGAMDFTAVRRPTEDPRPSWAASRADAVISPFRFLTEWRFPAILKAHFPARPFRVLDLGCGDGRYRAFFRSSPQPVTYVGLDLNERPQWKDPQASFPLVSVTFVASSAEEPQGLEGPFDMWITSSALEHFGDDGAAVENVSRLLAPGAIGVHAVPAHHSWMAYLKHGYRRYSAGSFSALFERHGHRVLAREGLGGPAAFLLHMMFMTFPQRVLRRPALTSTAAVGLYRRLMTLALRVDQILPSCFCLGYLVVIQYEGKGPRA